ncbi:hypothetical protein NE562_15825 [Butyricicoccus faecihominis]|nr:hypothetical protein [Butyricicoccus faecihominis]
MDHIELFAFHLSITLRIKNGRDGWIRFSAEKPRRLQHATGMLPKAAFRIQQTHRT